MKYVFFLLCVGGITISCGPGVATHSLSDAKTDPHSFADPAGIVTAHLDIEMHIDFGQRLIRGKAVHTLRRVGPADTYVVDIRGLDIQKVTAGSAEQEVAFRRGDEDEILGRALRIPVSAKDETVTIFYTVPSQAPALGWLDPGQTAGKTSPFLYTQGQAILSRTWLPVQDSPGIRFTYAATVHVPAGLMAAMSATNPQSRTPDGIYRFSMPHPVPAYLIALAVGDFDFAPVGPRTGVYAEPPLLESAQYEFAEMEQMLTIAERLYGTYLWDRYDVIILPPAFPFGGMENPMLTFLTPTCIAGDRSLVSLIAHELAHSWSGNLVTNATWNDFWLNEGFTTYFENRIMEALHGDAYARMLALLGRQDLQSTVTGLGADHKDTHLYLDLTGRDPDDGMNHIAYEKGAFFLKRLEQAAGREAFDTFLRAYFDTHRFQSMSTERFYHYLKTHLTGPLNLDVDIDAWIYGPGIPPDCPVVVSDKFDLVDNARAAFLTAGTLPPANNWSTHEWIHFIRQLPEEIETAKMSALDDAYGFTRSRNAEIAAAWYEVALKHSPAGGGESYASGIMPDIEQFLMEIGRRKFLVPLYREMKSGGRLEDARRIFRQAQVSYHAVSVQTLTSLLDL